MKRLVIITLYESFRESKSTGLVPLGAGPGAPLCFHAHCVVITWSPAVLWQCLLLDMDFSTQRRREQCRRTNKPSQPLAALQRVKGRRVRERVRDFRFQPVVTCAVSRPCDESDEEEEQDYITDTGMRLHQWDPCGGVWRMWPFSSSSSDGRSTSSSRVQECLDRGHPNKHSFI